MTELTAQIVATIEAIPEGKVTTYGGVGHIIERPRLARQVSWTLRTQGKAFNLPWQRVINSKGAISIPNEGGMIQKELLIKEGIKVDNQLRIDLKTYQWYPTPVEVEAIRNRAKRILAQKNKSKLKIH